MSLWQSSSTCTAISLWMLQPVWTHLFWIWAWETCDKRIYIIKSRIESSSERDQNQLEMWKKEKRYHVSEKEFDKKVIESRKVRELKKDGHYSYVSVISAQVVALYSSKNIIFCKRWLLGGERAWFCLLTLASSWHCEFWLRVLKWKDFLVNLIGTSHTNFIIQYIIYLCLSKKCFWCSFYCWHIFWQMNVWVQTQQLNKTTFFIHWMICEEWTNIEIMHHTFINAT